MGSLLEHSLKTKAEMASFRKNLQPADPTPEAYPSQPRSELASFRNAASALLPHSIGFVLPASTPAPAQPAQSKSAICASLTGGIEKEEDRFCSAVRSSEPLKQPRPRNLSGYADPFF
jgi:hypothetical protein